MALLKWSPRRDMFDMFEEFNRMVDQMIKTDRGMTEDETFAGTLWAPRVNIAETNDNYMVELELPGVKKDDVKITFKDHILTIEGEKKMTNELKEDDFIRKESIYGKFSRSFRLPEDVEVDKIDANYKDGILTITLPRVEEKKPKQIEVKVK